MGKRILVACHGDWNSVRIASALSRLIPSTKYVTTIGKHKIPEDLRSKTELFLDIRVFSKLFAIGSGSRTFYSSQSVFAEYRYFDLRVSRLIRRYKPHHCLLWSNMAKNSLATAKEAGSRSILICGSTSLQTFDRSSRESVSKDGFVNDRWIANQGCEFDLADLIVVESSFVRDDLVSEGVNQKKIVIIPPCSGIGLSQPERTSRKGGLSFGTVQLRRRKGTHKILEWWKELKFDASHNLVLVGDRNQFQNDPEEYLFNNVNFTGVLDRDRYVQVLSEIDVALFPTFGDGGPRSLVEMMSLGACPITSERCAGNDFINNGENGFVVPLAAEDQWKSVLLWCVKNVQCVNEMGENARRYAREKLNVRMFEEMIQSLVDT